MKAFILAAGLGTRLYPYTVDKPKALVEVGGITLLERAIRKVNELEVSEIIVNIHHFGDKIIDFLKEKTELSPSGYYFRRKRSVAGYRWSHP